MNSELWNSETSLKPSISRELKLQFTRLNTLGYGTVPYFSTAKIHFKFTHSSSGAGVRNMYHQLRTVLGTVTFRDICSRKI